MPRYTLHLHFAATQIPPFGTEIEPTQSLAIVFATRIAPLVDKLKLAGTGGRREGVAWQFKVQREDGSWDDLDPNVPLQELQLPVGSTVHVIDITSSLLR